MKCLFLTPTMTGEAAEVYDAVRRAARDAKVQLISRRYLGIGSAPTELIWADIARADLILADLSDRNSSVAYLIGLAHASGKPVVFLVGEETRPAFLDIRFLFSLQYDRSPRGLANLRAEARDMFEEFKRHPMTFDSSPLGPTSSLSSTVNLEKLGAREFENLCFELLTQMGFKRVAWGKNVKAVDVVATLPKKDPDGFEYDELWLISMGLHAPADMLFDMLRMEPEHLLDSIIRPGFAERLPRPTSAENAPITVLFIQPQEEHRHTASEVSRLENRLSRRNPAQRIRIRLWDRQQLLALIRQYPQIVRKYFSDEGRSQSRSRKTLEQLYLENASLIQENQTTITALEQERDRRVRAERDAIWKDVAFTAAHKLGNPIFALETNLQGIRRKISTRPEQAIEVAGEMGESIEKAKTIIAQFKSLTKASEIALRPVDLIPLINNAARVAIENGVSVAVRSTGSVSVQADPTRITECLDELFANALHWLSKAEKRISVTVGVATERDLPASLDRKKKYVRIRFEDNGVGIPPDDKEKVFAPFFTTYPHGTGLGLSLVQRVIEGHGGAIREVGSPDEGAAFEAFLLQAQTKRRGK